MIPSAIQGHLLRCNIAMNDAYVAPQTTPFEQYCYILSSQYFKHTNADIPKAWNGYQMTPKEKVEALKPINECIDSNAYLDRNAHLSVLSGLASLRTNKNFIADLPEVELVKIDTAIIAMVESGLTNDAVKKCAKRELLNIAVFDWKSDKSNAALSTQQLYAKNINNISEPSEKSLDETAAAELFYPQYKEKFAYKK